MLCWVEAEVPLAATFWKGRATLALPVPPGMGTQMNTDLPCVGKAGLTGGGGRCGDLVSSELRDSMSLRPQKSQGSQP